MTISSKVLGILGLCMKSGGLCFGTDACMDQIQRKKVKFIIVAKNASDRTKRNFEYATKQNNIEICFFGSIEEISKAIGKDNKAVIGIKNKNFAEKLAKMINGGEVIG